MSRALPFVTSFVLFCLGLAFCWFLWQSYQKVAPTHQWPQVETKILSSKVVEYFPSAISQPQYRVELIHSYEYEGVAYVSSHIRPRQKNFLRQADARAEVEAFPAGAQLPAWVNPQQPDFGILQLDSKAMLYALPMPLFLLILSSIGMYRCVFPKKLKPNSCS